MTLNSAGNRVRSPSEMSKCPAARSPREASQETFVDLRRTCNTYASISRGFKCGAALTPRGFLSGCQTGITDGLQDFIS